MNAALKQIMFSLNFVHFGAINSARLKTVSQN